MSRSYLTRAVNTPVPQSKPLKGQIKNSAGGYVYQVDKWVALHRWLVLGSEGGTYYIGEVDLTKANMDIVNACLDEDPMRTIDMTVSVIKNRRAAKMDTALYTLAMCMTQPGRDLAVAGKEAEDAPTRIARRTAQNQVAHLNLIGTHLFKLAEFVDQIGGWGSGIQRAFGSWFFDGANQDVRHLAYEVVKYQQREGWSMADLLRKAHMPQPTDPLRNAILKWVVDGEYTDFQRDVPELDPIWGYREIRIPEADAKIGRVTQVIRQFRLPREAVPSELLKRPEVWDALVDDMPVGALVRNLATLTRLEVVKPLNQGRTTDVVNRLTHVDQVKRSHIHPINVLAGMITYASGKSVKGSNTWTPVPQIVGALDKTFYLAFQNVVPSNKRIMLALDISGSMKAPINGMDFLSARDGSTAMALVTTAAEPNTMAVAFCSSASSVGAWGFPGNVGRYAAQGFPAGIMPIDISGMRLDRAIEYGSQLPMGGTDCALPMLYAAEKGLLVDAFVIYTDNETWAGDIHPSEALKRYRTKMQMPEAKLIVVAMTATGFSIADPADPNMLDVVGFDTTTPAVISNFIAGDPDASYNTDDFGN